MSNVPLLVTLTPPSWKNSKAKKPCLADVVTMQTHAPLEPLHVTEMSVVNPFSSRSHASGERACVYLR